MSEEKKPFHNPFGALAGLSLPEGPKKPATPSAVPKGPARAVVRYERKGRGGKEVTLIEQLELKEAELDAWLKGLKQALGCGGTRDGATLVLQGDQRERVEALLVGRGVRKVSVG
jgi:translation initiation factor 1